MRSVEVGVLVVLVLGALLTTAGELCKLLLYLVGR
jgi:hypothetical protein